MFHFMPTSLFSNFCGCRINVPLVSALNWSPDEGR